QDLRPAALAERKERLRALLAGAPPRIVPVDPVEEHGEALFDEVRRRGLEGMVAKRAGSAYAGGRSADWRKVRCERRGRFLVVGYTRPGLGMDGGLHLARRVGGGLLYAGRVGSGFEAGVLEQARALLLPLAGPHPACAGALPGGRDHTWVSPLVECEVRYLQRTQDGL